VKRSAWVTGAVVAHFLWAGLFLAMSILLLMLTRHPEVKYGKDAAAVVHGLKIAFGLSAPIAVILFLGAWGLAKAKLWGWWLALLMDAGLFGVCLYSLIDDGLNNIDWDIFAFTGVMLLLVVWLVLPVVRESYWKEAPLNASTTLKQVAAGK
jgi:hypothetical protein